MPTSSRSQDAAFHAFLAEGTIRLQRCTDCGYMRPPTGFVCPQCLSERWDWSSVDGGAIVEGCTWYMQPLHPRFTDVPYNVALVRLDEGVRLIASVEEVAPGELQPGQRLRAKIATSLQGNPVVAFRPEKPQRGPSRAAHPDDKETP